MIGLLSLALIFSALSIDFVKTKVFLSPNQIFLVSVLVIYVLPGVLRFNTQEVDWYSLFLIISYQFFRRLTSLKINRIPHPTRINFKNLLFLGFLLQVSYLYITVDYSIDTLIKRIVDPRSFTYISESMGPFVMVIGAINSFIIYSAINNLILSGKIQIETVGSLVLILLSASKTTFINLILIYIIFKQVYYRIKYKYVLFIIPFIFFMIYLSFALYGGAGVINFDFEYFYQNFITYFKEYDATQRVIKDFQYELIYTWDLFYQTIITPIPRFFWEEKPYVSYYHTYWKQLYEPDVPIFHTTTYGCIAEAVMAFGILGPLIYGFIFSQYIRITENLRFNSRNFVDIYIAVNMMFLIFFFVRAGIFFTTIWQLIIVVCIFKTLAKLLPYSENKITNFSI